MKKVLFVLSLNRFTEDYKRIFGQFIAIIQLVYDRFDIIF